jgi:hypothetical protein
MKKLLGKVSVYLDDTLTGESSRLDVLGFGTYEILLTPKEDKAQMESRGVPYNASKNTATTLAHEFGHLIGRLLGSHAQNQSHTLVSEQEAWALANIEYPDLDKAEEHLALGLDAEVYGQ